MDTKLLETLGRQIRELDRANGSQALGDDFLKALAASVSQFDDRGTLARVERELVSLYDVLLDCHPRMANILFDLQYCILHLSSEGGDPSVKVEELVKELLRRKEARLEQATQHAVSFFKEERCLLLHSYSTSLIHLLNRAAKHAVKPKVIVAAQEKEKTDKVIRTLTREGFDFYVVSEYSLSHVIDQVDTAIFGGLTLNQDADLVLAPGSASLIAQLSGHEIPRYVYLPTNKFSLWAEPPLTAFKEVRSKLLEGIEYEKHVFSHDVISSRQVTGVITEKGILPPEGAMEVFRSLQDKFADHERRIRQAA